MKKLVFFFILLSAQAFASVNDLSCDNVQQRGDDLLQLNKVTIHLEIDRSVKLNLEMINGDKKNLELKATYTKEKDGDADDLIIENDDLVFVISLQGKAPYQGAINPIYVEGKNYGPYYFLCQEVNP